MITFVCFRWGKYLPYHVNTFYSMLERNLTLPFEFVCCTEDGRGIDKRIRIVPIDTSLIPLGNAYPKLMVFQPDAALIFGKRICLVDLDAVIIAPLDSLVNRTENFVIWRDVASYKEPKRFIYNTSMLLMDAGSRSEVWESFDPVMSPEITSQQGLVGSDQAWVSYKLPNDESTWNCSDGILSWRLDVLKNGISDSAKIIFFHGRPKPWELSNLDIVKKHYY